MARITQTKKVTRKKVTKRKVYGASKRRTKKA